MIYAVAAWSHCPGCGEHRHKTLKAAEKNAARMARAVAKATNGPAPLATFGVVLDTGETPRIGQTNGK